MAVNSVLYRFLCNNFHFICVSCLKSDRKTDLPSLELFEKKKKEKNEPYGFRIRAARVITNIVIIRLQRQVAEEGKKKLCRYDKLLINDLCLECTGLQLYAKYIYIR